MKLSLTFILSITAICSCWAEAKDPFDDLFKDPKPKAKEHNPFDLPPEAEDQAKNIIVGFELIVAPRLKALKLMELDGSVAREMVQNWIDAGEAHVGETSLSIGGSGSRGRTRSEAVWLFPKQELVDSKPPINLQWVYHHLGTSFEFDPVTTPDSKIDLNLNLRLDRLTGEPQPIDMDRERIIGGLKQPTFAKDQFATSFLLEGPEATLVRVSSAAPGFSSNDKDALLVFMRADLLPVPEVELEIDEYASYRLRTDLIEVDAKAWNDWAKNQRLRTLIQDAPKEFRGRVDRGEAELLHLELAATKFGQRARSEAEKWFFVPQNHAVGDEEDQPSEGTHYSHQTIGFRSNFGGSLSAGGYLHLDFSMDHISHPTDQVYRRIKRGDEWVPDLTVPIPHYMSATTSLKFHRNTPLLVGIHTPVDDNGEPDHSRKVLLIVEWM